MLPKLVTKRSETNWQLGEQTFTHNLNPFHMSTTLKDYFVLSNVLHFLRLQIKPTHTQLSLKSTFPNSLLPHVLFPDIHRFAVHYWSEKFFNNLILCEFYLHLAMTSFILVDHTSLFKKSITEFVSSLWCLLKRMHGWSLRIK